MRVLFRKFYCPSFICFCKPSPHLLSPSPLKLEDAPHFPSTVPSVSEIVTELSDEKIEESLDGELQIERFPKSSLKKPSSESGGQKEARKKTVQWMDFSGKELVHIKEFEPSESEDSEDGDEGNRGCVCVIQ